MDNKTFSSASGKKPKIFKPSILKTITVIEKIISLHSLLYIIKKEKAHKRKLLEIQEVKDLPLRGQVKGKMLIILHLLKEDKNIFQNKNP